MYSSSESAAVVPHEMAPSSTFSKYLGKFFGQETLWNMDFRKGEQNRQAKAVPQTAVPHERAANSNFSNYLGKFFGQETLWNTDFRKGDQNSQTKAVPQTVKFGPGRLLSEEEQTFYGNWGAV